MYRFALEKLKEWKADPYRKPLIIQGARQVGKTWLMQEFGRQEYADVAYVNFDQNTQMRELFSGDLSVGLFSCMAGIGQQTLLEGNQLFTECKGALTEQFVLQQLKTREDLQIYYFANDRGNGEIDFLADTGEDIIPLEVKAEENLRAKSLQSYREKYAPFVSVRTSMSDYRKQDWLINLPLYAIENFPGM